MAAAHTRRRFWPKWAFPRHQSLLSHRLRVLLGAGSLLLAGLLIARAPLTLTAAGILGGIGAALLLLQPTLGLYALAFAVPFGSLRQLSFGGMTVGPSEILLAGMLSAWGLRLMQRQRMAGQHRPSAGPIRPLAPPLLTGALLLYLAVLCLSLIPSTALLPAIKELAKWFEFLALYLFVSSGCAGVDTPREGRQRGVVAALLMAGVLQGALGIHQFLHQVGPEGFVLLGRYMRAHGTFLQPNPFGGYMGLCLPLAYATALTTWREARRSWRHGVSWPAVLWALALCSGLIMLAALVMSWSRGALLGLLGGIALVALALGRRYWALLIVAALLVLLLGPALSSFVPANLLQRLTGISEYVGRDLSGIEIDDDNFSVIERLAHWTAAWRMFAERPWLGAGVGQYATAYPTVALPRWSDPLGHAHNYYLNVLAEGGLIGLAAYLIFLLAAIAGAWRAGLRERGWRQGLALGALGMLGHLALHSLVDNLYVHEMYLLVAMVLGLAVGHGAPSPPQHERPTGT